jgi:hypothetical protein
VGTGRGPRAPARGRGPALRLWGGGADGRSALILMVGKKWEIDEEGILCLIQSSSGSVSSPARARALRQDPS